MMDYVKINGGMRYLWRGWALSAQKILRALLPAGPGIPGSNDH